MISQRPADAAPCVGGEVENLPFADNSFDGAMALLTLHHWRDIWRGLSELKRVVRYADLLDKEEIDLGYRLIVAEI